jgi:NADH-quinone oxidoreductase subunit J
MLDIDFAELRQGMINYLPVGATIGLILLVELVLVVAGWSISPDLLKTVTAPTPPLADVTNTEALGRILYTKYIYYFQAAGLVLLVSMIGAIVLTLRHKPNVKRQSVSEQVARGPATAIEIRNVKPGQGI